MASARLTREWILAKLEDALPEVTWQDGVLLFGAATDKTVGGIFTRNETQGDNDQSVTRQIVVQLGLPNSMKPGPRKVEARGQGDLEDLAQDVTEAIRASNAETVGKPDGYWFTRYVRTDYGYDSQGQLTRAEITFNARGESLWA